MQILTEQQICTQLMKWLQEGEAYYNDPDKRCKIQKHPNTLHGYMQIIGWVTRDLRVSLDIANAEIRRLDKIIAEHYK